jgi:hypothetical protein
MDFDELHAPGEGNPKNFTQMISMVVGALLFILCLSGIMNPRFAGLNLSLITSLIAGFAGVTLFYSGYKNYSRPAFRSCLGFGIFYLLYALVGYMIGGSAETDLTVITDESYYRIFPDFNAKSMVDHAMNAIIGLVLLGGAADWWRRGKEYQNRGKNTAEPKLTKPKTSHKTLAHR